MCGINGVYHFNNSRKIQEKEILKMRDTLIHRGPDDAGIYISENKKVGFGTRRLKIIDLSSAGHMPMTDMAKSAWITYNGEVYNFKELRKELESRGRRFMSQTDTEVILNAYLEYGPECVERFNGMFAFAIWDDKEKTLFAARDHLGIKPFYYALTNGSFYFGSEIKAILAHPDVKKELDESSLSYYLTFSCLPAPHTLFRGIKKLAPARYLIIKENGEVKEKEYWNPATAKKQGNSEEYFISETRRLLKESIKSQMVSDVPFGCFLSGGIDSSTNAALMSEALGRPVETFSVGSKDFEKYNEFKYSRMMAKKLGTKPHEILVGDDEMMEFLEQYAFFSDDPSADQVCLPLFYLSKLARDNGVIMVQIGEGSDEIFTGYNTYLKAVSLYNNLWKHLEKLPDFLKNGAFKASSLLKHPRFEFHKEYLRRLKEHQEPFWGNAIAFSDYQKEKLLTGDFQKKISASASSYSIIENYYEEIKEIDNSADFLKRLTYLEIKHRLSELLLMRADKMTMANSIEARVPFLDRRLVELALQMPSELKIKNNTAKYILKKAVEGIIPDEIIWREKQGFATPMSEWLKPDSKISKYMTDIIMNSKLRERGIFNYDYIEKLISAHQHQSVEHNFRIWNLITLSLWYDYWFG